MSWQTLEDSGWRKRVNSKTNRYSYVRPNNRGIVTQKRQLSVRERDEIGDILFPGRVPKVPGNPNSVEVSASGPSLSQSAVACHSSLISRPSPSSSLISRPGPSSTLDSGPCTSTSLVSEPCLSTSNVSGPSLPSSHIFCDVSDPSSSSFCQCQEIPQTQVIITISQDTSLGAGWGMA